MSADGELSRLKGIAENYFICSAIFERLYFCLSPEDEDGRDEIESLRRFLAEFGPQFPLDLSQSETSCPYSHIPNEETAQVLRDADAGIGLTHCGSTEELFEQLGI